jgi:alpha-glucosidase
VELPAGADWFDFWTGARFAGASTIDLPAPFERPPLLARAGSLIAVDLAPAGFGPRDRQAGYLVFPLENGDFGLDLFEDDGETPIDLAVASPCARIDVNCRADRIAIRLTGTVELTAERWRLPAGEARALTIEGA